MFGVVRAITVVTVVRSIAILIIKIAVNIAMIVLSCVVVGFLKIFDAVVVVVRFVDVLGIIDVVVFAVDDTMLNDRQYSLHFTDSFNFVTKIVINLCLTSNLCHLIHHFLLFLTIFS